MYSITPAQHEDVAVLAASMRAEDAAEMEALGWSPIEALEHSYAASRETYSGWADGRLVCMWGLHKPTALSDIGVPWMLTTEEMTKHSKALLPVSKAMIETWAPQFRALENYVDARYVQAVRWMKWLGFQIVRTEPKGPRQVPFHLMQRIS